MLEPLETTGPAESEAAISAAAPPPPAAKTDRDVQRAALRELVELSSACAVAEAEIEAVLRRELEDAQKKLAKATDDAAQTLLAKQEEVAAKHAARAGEIDAIAEKELAALKSSVGDRRSRIHLDNESMEQQLRTQLEKAEWLAESLFEGTQNHLRAEMSKLNEAVAAELRTIDEREAAVEELLSRYGVSVSRTTAEAASVAAPADAGQAERDVKAFREEAEHHLEHLKSLFLPKLFVGARPVIIVLLLCAIAAVVGQLVAVEGVPADVLNEPPQWRQIGIAAGGTFLGALLIGGGLMLLGKSQVRKGYIPFREARDGARRAAEAQRSLAAKTEQRKLAHAVKKRDLELAAAREKFAPTLERIRRNRAAAVQTVELEQKRNRDKIQSNRDASRAELDAWRTRVLEELQQRHNAQLKAARDSHDATRRVIEKRHADARAKLQKQWADGLRAIQAPIEETGGGNGHVIHDWTTMNWKQWSPPKRFTSKVRFGELQVDLQRITDDLPRSLELPPAFALPAVLALPRQASLLIHTDHAGRGDAIHILQMLMARLLTSLPAGRVRFTIIDPVSLGQNFAGFMHLADHDEALVGGRIWTEPEHIEQRLADLTEHMETVIQKYLRNEFETIDDYNAQAGELAEPYRFLVIADLPAGFSSDSFRRLSSIAASGARCGIYTLVVRDTGQALPSGSRMDQLESSSVNLVREGNRFVWRDEVFQQFPLTVDPPPPESSLTEMLDVVGKAAKENKRIEVSFDTIAPAPEQLWSRSTANEVEVPIGRLGATRLQNLRLGRGVAQHVLIAGKTGSGKSTLLHALVTNLAMWYSPQEVEFYLVDFKKGVEFKTYATHRLPHARAIAVESDREFGLSVLQRVDAELARRGELYRKAGTQDLASYRKSPGAVAMPRTLLIIDEFQEFFSEDDKLAQDAGVLLDRLVRQGRAFGIHVLLGSQTIGGSSGLARSTIGQMAVRIALQTSEADSQLILGDTNSAARLLSRPGEAIYNDQGGLVEGNSPFQIAWLPDPKREIYLARVREKADASNVREEPGVVFEGNAPADVRKNMKLAALLAGTDGVARSPVPLGWLGDPVAIKDPTAVAFRRQNGANVLIVGQQDEGAMGIMATAMVGLAAQDARRSAKFYVLDGTPADSPLAGIFNRVAEAIPQETKLVEWRAVESTIDELSKELARRQVSDESQPPPIYLFVYALQRYRMLRKTEDEFSFGSSADEEKKANPGKQFAELLREGPPHGMHVIAWSDTPAAIERTLDRASLREFDNRVLFQMSANDSSNLIDSPMANKLGQNRALAYSEEQGVMEKFRPYAVPTDAWLRDVNQRLAK